MPQPDRDASADRAWRAEVANGELRVDGQTYDLAGVTSARIVEVPTAATGPILMGVTGFVFLAAAAGDFGPAGLPVGLGFLAGAVLWWRAKKPQFQLRLETPSGEICPIEDPDRDAVAAVLREIGDPPAAT